MGRERTWTAAGRGFAGRRRTILAAMLGWALVCSFTWAFAAPARALEADKSTPTLQVVGRGRVSVAPSRALISTVAEGTGTTPAEAEQAAGSLYEAIRQAMDQLGFETIPGPFSLNPRWEYPPEGGPVPSGFEARRNVDVVVRDVSRLSEAVQALLDTGITMIYNVSYSADGQSDAGQEATRLALDDARQKAELIARQAGLALGPILSITADAGPSALYEGMVAATSAIEPSHALVEVTVTIVYQLLKP